MAKVGEIYLRVPKQVKRGEVFKVKFVVIHPMETGRRKDPKTGKTIPPHYITKVELYYDDALVNEIETSPAISANPYFILKLKALQTGKVKVVVYDNKGGKWEKSALIKVV